MNIFFSAYQKIIQITVLIGGLIGLYIWIRKDAYDEGQEALERRAYEDYFEQSENIRQINHRVDSMSDDDVDKLLKKNNWNFR